MDLKQNVLFDMASSGVDIIFATSFGYMEPMLKVAKEFPDVKFNMQQVISVMTT